MGQRVTSFKRETNSVESVKKSKRFFFSFNEVCTDYSGSSGPLLSLMIRILFLSLGNFTFLLLRNNVKVRAMFSHLMFSNNCTKSL